MAIVKFGTMIIGARGTIGGATFSVNGSGPYAKSWSYSTSPQSEPQIAQQANLASLGDLWTNLTDAERAAWDTFAADPLNIQTNSLGETFFLSGWQWFSKSNLWLFTVGRAAIVAPPVPGPPAALSTLGGVIHASGGAQSNITVPPGELGVFFDLVITVALSPSKASNAAPANEHVVATFQAPGGTQFFFQPGLEAAFGTIQIDQRGYIRAYRQLVSGYRSPPQLIARNAI